MTEPALLAEDLEMGFSVRGRVHKVLHGVSFRIASGEAYGLVGESGCGKFTAALAAVGYLARNGRILGGRIAVDGRDLRSLGKEELRQLRATSVAMVHQDPGKALNPSIHVGGQMMEVYEHERLPRSESRSRAVEMFRRVRITDPQAVLERYPHQLSGGMQQRICLAMALAKNPSLLILDEPTTGLDATVEAEVLDLVRQLRSEFSTAILLKQITEAVRLAERCLEARPRQLSGGLKQCVAIARSFAGEPSIVVCDEPTSALDVSVQAAILNLLVDLQVERQVSYIVISHDLGVVRYLSDRIAALYLGRLMEIGPAEQVFSGPHHPYTEALLSAVPDVDGRRKDRVELGGEMPSAVNLPKGCVFHTRCPRRIGTICDETEPALVAISGGHDVRCHLPIDGLGRTATG